MKPSCVWHHGEPRWEHKPGGEKLSYSGANFSVSNASWVHIKRQLADAVRFLKKHRRDIKKLSKMPGIQFLFLDVAVERRPESIVQREEFSAELAKLLGSLGLGLTVSLYPETDSAVKSNRGDRRTRG
jgi:hypothetical protein